MPIVPYTINANDISFEIRSPDTAIALFSLNLVTGEATSAWFSADWLRIISPRAITLFGAIDETERKSGALTFLQRFINASPLDDSVLGMSVSNVGDVYTLSVAIAAGTAPAHVIVNLPHSISGGVAVVGAITTTGAGAVQMNGAVVGYTNANTIAPGVVTNAMITAGAGIEQSKVANLVSDLVTINASLATKAQDSEVVKLAGTQSITGLKTFTKAIEVPGVYTGFLGATGVGDKITLSAGRYTFGPTVTLTTTPSELTLSTRPTDLEIYAASYTRFDSITRGGNITLKGGGGDGTFAYGGNIYLRGGALSGTVVFPITPGSVYVGDESTANVLLGASTTPTWIRGKLGVGSSSDYGTLGQVLTVDSNGLPAWGPPPDLSNYATLNSAQTFSAVKYFGAGVGADTSGYVRLGVNPEQSPTTLLSIAPAISAVAAVGLTISGGQPTTGAGGPVRLMGGPAIVSGNGGALFLEGGYSPTATAYGAITIGANASPTAISGATSAITIGRSGITTTINGTLKLATLNATADTITLAATTGAGLLKLTSASLLTIQPAESTLGSSFSVSLVGGDNNRVTTGGTGGTANVTGGAAKGLNGNGGNVNIEGGAKTGTGAGGIVFVGTSPTTSQIQIGGPASSTIMGGTLTLGSGIIIPASNGGTGISSYAMGDLLYASAANTLSVRAAGLTGQVLTMLGNRPTWVTPSGGGSGTVTNVSGSTTLSGLTLGVATQTTTPVISLTGTLGASSGGTGAAGTLTGYVKAAGAATMTASAAIPVADVTGAAPIASPAFTGTVTIPAGASISGFAPIASPAFTGTPSLPTGTTGVTQSASNSSTSLATTAFVKTAGPQIYGAGNATAFDTTSDTADTIIPGCTVTLANTSGVARSYFIQVSNGGLTGTGGPGVLGLIRIYIGSLAVSLSIDATATGSLFYAGTLATAATDVITLRWAAFAGCTLTTGLPGAVGFTVVMPAA